MSDFKIKTYKPSDKTLWNDFASKSNQDTFLFQRDFMDYHSDRFQDFSLLVYKKEKVIALLPANVVNNSVYSHQGLSYGGFIVKPKIRFNDYVKVVENVLKYLESKNKTALYMKQLPVIYNKYLSEEWNYISSIIGAEDLSVDSYFVIDDLQGYVPNRNRKRAITNAESKNIYIVNKDIDFFWEHILSENLAQKYGVQPVHTVDEIKLLMQRFPDYIKFYATHIDNQMTAGVVLFETENTLHFQYSSGDEQRTETGSLDFLFNYVIEKYKHKKHISFGSSSTNKSLKINKGLMYWKESFGAKLIPQKTFVIKTEMYKNLKLMFQ